MSEQRLPFSDYPANEQKKDVERFESKQKKDVYIVRVNGVWNAYVARKKYPLAIPAERGEELTDFIVGLKKSLEEMAIKPNFHCIRNKGVEDYLKQQMIIHNLIGNCY